MFSMNFEGEWVAFISMLELFSLKKKNFIELVACTIKKEKKRKENGISNWSRKQDDVPIDI